MLLPHFSFSFITIRAKQLQILLPGFDARADVKHHWFVVVGIEVDSRALGAPALVVADGVKIEAIVGLPDWSTLQRLIIWLEVVERGETLTAFVARLRFAAHVETLTTAHNVAILAKPSQG